MSTRAAPRSGSIITVLVLAFALTVVPGPSATAVAPCATVIAHRGNTTSTGLTTENSIGGFEASFAAGATWIETDVRFTSDNVPVLMHDATIDRTATTTGTVATMTAAQFAAVTLKDGQHPPTLDQVLTLVRSNPDRHLMMEIKAIKATQESILLNKLRGLESQVYVNGFPAFLTNMQRLKISDPPLNISLAVNSPVLPVPTGISGEDVEHTSLTQVGVAQLHAAGATVRAWVPDGATAWRNLGAIGVDAIMTNNTAAYVPWSAPGACPVVPLPPIDVIAPKVSLLRPDAGATVSGSVTVTGTAADEVALGSVSLLVDGTATDTVAPATDGGFTFTWDSASVPSGGHALQVRARDAAGNEALSGIVSVTVQNVDEGKPTPPTALSGTWSSPDRVALTWEGSTDNAAVSGYRVYRGDRALTEVGPNVRSYTDSGLAEFTTYTYRVTALDAAGNESDASEQVVVETGDGTAPSVPPVAATLSGTDAAEVTWTPSTDNTGVAGYRVYRNEALVDTVDEETARFVDTGLDDGVAYAYGVVAFDGDGNSSDPDDPAGHATVTTPDTTPPGAPGTLTAVSGSQSVSLAWTAATDNVGVTQYVVHRDGARLTTLPASARSYTDGGLDTTTAHQYQVTALDAAGLEGPGSNVVARSFADTTAPTAPTSLTRVVSGFTVRLTWTPSTDDVGVTGYTVYRAGVAIGTTTTASTYTDSAAPPGRTYTYTVRARDAAGNLSPASAGVSATLPVDRTAPTAPSGLRATVGPTGSRQITLTWNASSDNAGVTSYYVFRGNAKYRALGNVLTFTDTGLSAGTRYTYKVYALDASGNWSGPSGNVSATAR